MSDDYLAVLVWILRMVLPCILFWISFGPRLRTLWQHPPVSKNVMLAHREIVTAVAEEAPEALANLMMVDAQTAPMLFTERRTSREDRPRGERPDRGERGDRGEREHGELRERGDRGDRPPRTSGRDRRRPPSPDAVDQELLVNEADLVEAQRQQAADDQMHLESLVNFVAFSRREQQRVFLPDTFCVPPPPPMKPPKMPKPAASQAPGAPSAAVQRANAEAQMVLRGAVKKDSCGVVAARALHDQLTELGIDLMPLTFELIVETCIQANQLKYASNFLMKMEEAGQTPSSELLDRVMELYLEHKRLGQDQIQEPNLTQSASHDDNSTADRSEAHDRAVPGAGHGQGEHVLDVEGLKRLAMNRQPPPPPPLPPDLQGGHVPPQMPVQMMGGYPLDPQFHMMNHAPLDFNSGPSILLPSQWHPRIPNRTLPPARSSEGYAVTLGIRGKKLPAFSIPDEFAVPAEAREGSDEEEAGDPAHDAEPAEGDQVAASSSRALARDEDGSKTWLSRDAAEFVPGGIQDPAGGRPSLMSMVGPQGADPFAGPYSDACGVNPESWGYMQQDARRSTSSADQPDWPVPEEAHAAPYSPDGPAGDGFEFSASAAVFTPIAFPSAADQAQSQFAGGMRYTASPFVPGTFPTYGQNPDQVPSQITFPNGMRGQVCGPPVMMPVNHVIGGEERFRSEEECFDGDTFRGGDDFEGRQQSRSKVSQTPGSQKQAIAKLLEKGGAAVKPKAKPKSRHVPRPVGELAEPLPPGPMMRG